MKKNNNYKGAKISMVTFESLISKENKIAVVGLGYVGLPLAVHLAAHFDVVGFDLKTDRIDLMSSAICHFCPGIKTRIRKKKPL